MTQTTFTDNVLVQGSRDIQQLEVKGHSTQTQPLQKWSDNAGTLKGQMTADGRLQAGNNLGVGAPADALIQANNDVVLPSSALTSGLHTLGRITGALSSLVNWAVHELQFLGTGGVSGVQVAARTKLTHSNTGSSTTAELRATDSQATNETGTTGTRVGQITGFRATASNATNAALNKAVAAEVVVLNDTSGDITQAAGVSVVPLTNKGIIATLLGILVGAPTNSGGSITTAYGVKVEDQLAGTTNYAIYTGKGCHRLGDRVEIVGSTDNKQLTVAAVSGQTQDLQQWQDSGAGALSVVNKNGWIGAGVPDPKAKLHGASFGLGVVAKTGNYTLTDSDAVCLVVATSSVITITLPSAIPIIGRIYLITRVYASTQNVTVNTSSSQTINGAASVTLTSASPVLRIISDGANWYTI